MCHLIPIKPFEGYEGQLKIALEYKKNTLIGLLPIDTGPRVFLKLDGLEVINEVTSLDCDLLPHARTNLPCLEWTHPLVKLSPLHNAHYSVFIINDTSLDYDFQPYSRISPATLFGNAGTTCVRHTVM